MVSKNSAKIKILNLKKELGTQYISHKQYEAIASEILLKISNELPIGGILILDFKDVELISSLFIVNLVNGFFNKAKKRGEGLFRGRFVVAKDPNEDIIHILEICAKQKHASILVFITDPETKKVTPYKVLNLPKYLRETLDIIEEYGPINSQEVAKRLGEEKGRSARERLRQLYRKGLVTREAVGTHKGERYFSYKQLIIDL